MGLRLGWILLGSLSLSILGKVVTKTGSDDSDADVAILPLLLPNPNQADGSYTPDQLTAISILQRRMSAAVDLVKALGGGWDASTLPSGDALRTASLADPKNTENVARPVSK